MVVVDDEKAGFADWNCETRDKQLDNRWIVNFMCVGLEMEIKILSGAHTHSHGHIHTKAHAHTHTQTHTHTHTPNICLNMAY